MIGLTKSVAADYVAQGIRAICPGTVDSPSLQDRLRAGGDDEAARAAFVARQPIGRIGQPNEIADLVVYLATATYTTGQIHVIDGAWTARPSAWRTMIIPTLVRSPFSRLSVSRISCCASPIERAQLNAPS